MITEARCPCTQVDGPTASSTPHKHMPPPTAPTCAQVPRNCAWTREENSAWAQVWPIQFREPEPAVRRELTPLPASEVGAMARHMGRAWQLARGSAARGQVANACIIVDPVTGGRWDWEVGGAAACCSWLCHMHGWLYAGA